VSIKAYQEVLVQVEMEKNAGIKNVTPPSQHLKLSKSGVMSQIDFM
jgi:hypothetical protein